MQFLKAILLIICVSGFAHGDSRTRIADFKSDYLCYFLDAQGFHSDEGYAISILPDACVDLRFVEEPYVKYPLDCQLDIFETNQDKLVLRCKYPQNDLGMIFTMNRQSLDARVEVQTTPIDIFQLTCSTNR